MGKNDKVLSLKIPTKVLDILTQYESEKNFDEDFVFPELKKANINDPKDIQRKIATNTKIINKYLGRVAQKLELDKPLKNPYC